METLLLILASSGAFQQIPAPPPAADSVPAVAASATALNRPAAVPLGPVEEPRLWPLRPDLHGSPGQPQRPRAVEYSELYHVRLTVHKVTSIATIPLFAAQYVYGRRLYNDPTESDRQVHGALASGVAGLFAVNTVTGLWNLWDSRKTHEGALRRYLHSGLMLLADAGFVATGATAPDDDEGFTGSSNNRGLHRTLAIASMGTALVSLAMMILWKD